MSNTLLALPIVIPLITAILLILFGSIRWLRQSISLAGAVALFAAGIALLMQAADGTILATQLGGWRAPFGITLVADVLAALMVAITGFMGLTVVIYSFGEVDEGRQKFGFHPLYHVLLMGVCGAFLTGDMFNLFVWFEVMLMASFALLALGGERAQIAGAVKYLTLNFLASGLFLIGLGILYAQTGTLNMADLAGKLPGNQNGLLVLTAAMLFLVAFSVKAGLFPLFSWLPASYHTPPVAVTAIFAALLTKVGVYALIRVFTLIFTGTPEITHQILFWISLLTMVVGVLGAAAQFEMKRLLSFHIVSQIGYMTLGLALFTSGALAAALFYILHNILAKTNLFLVAGATEYVKGSTQLKKIGGLYKVYPWLSVLFLIPALSLAGVPPLSGFFAKFVLVRESMRLTEYLAVAIALAVGILTLYSMTKIWAEAFWKADPRDVEQDAPRRRLPWTYVFPMVCMAAATLYISLNPESLLQLANLAGEQLMDPARYIAAVNPEAYP